MLFDLATDPFEAIDRLAAPVSEAAQTKAIDLRQGFSRLKE